MATQSLPSIHDAVVNRAGYIYTQYGLYVWTNPGSEKNKAWNGRYIDVIVARDPMPTLAYVTEIETELSVSDYQAQTQWLDYDQAYQPQWYMAVPAASEFEANRLLKKYGIVNCKVITWRLDARGVPQFQWLPGLPQ